MNWRFGAFGDICDDVANSVVVLAAKIVESKKSGGDNGGRNEPADDFVLLEE